MGTLTAAGIRYLKPEAKKSRHWDGGGLYLEIHPSGRQVWMLKYRVTIQGGSRKEKRLLLGHYTQRAATGKLTLAQAREAALVAKQEIKQGRDPVLTKKAAKVQRVTEEHDTFRRVAMAWIEDASREAEWSKDHELKVSRSLELHAFPTLGDLPIVDIRAKHTFPVLQDLRRRSPDMADKVEQRIRATLDHAVYAGLIDMNPLPAKRPSKRKKKSFPAMLEPTALRQFLREAEAANISPGVFRAHLLLTFTCQRVGEVVGARWEEFDLNAGLWTIPRDQMKKKESSRPDQIIPLPSRLLQELRRWQEVTKGEYVCPGPRSGKPISRESTEKAYRVTLGYRDRHSPHSWRSAFSTLAHDAGLDHMGIELQLDHIIPGVAGVYDRGQRLEIRQEIVQWREDLLLDAG